MRSSPLHCFSANLVGAYGHQNWNLERPSARRFTCLRAESTRQAGAAKTTAVLPEKLCAIAPHFLFGLYAKD